MTWQQVRIKTNKEHSESIEQLLLEHESAAITLQELGDQPVYEPDLGTTPLWDELEIVGLFPADNDLSRLLEALETHFKDLFQSKVELVEDKDWSREWLKYYQPIQISQSLWICPHHLEAPNPEALTIKIDPGLAFGTGTHPTTALCLGWLDSQNLKGKSVIDFGCGSGILAMAAAKLDATVVYAIDNDPQAIIATKDNCQRNQIQDTHVLSCLATELESDKASDIIVANILANILIELSEEICHRLKPNGQLALSGILASQEQLVINAYRKHIEFEPTVYNQDWVLLIGRKISENARSTD